MRILGAVKRWAGGVLIGIDQLANTVVGGLPDETLSSRFGRMVKDGRKSRTGSIACAVLDAIDGDHCSSSIEEAGDGATDPHHLGRVIRERRRDPLDVLRKASPGGGE